MDEKAFWSEIYLLVKRDWPEELESLGHCDWIETSKYLLGSINPHIVGRMGLIGGSASELRFELYLDGKPEDLMEIRWSEMIPSSEPTGWISYDPVSEILELNPTSAR